MTVRQFDSSAPYSLSARLFNLVICYTLGTMLITFVMHYFGITPNWAGLISGLLGILTLTTLDATRPQWHPALRVALGLAVVITTALLAQALLR